MVLAAASASLFAFGTKRGAIFVELGAFSFNSCSTCGWNILGLLSTEVFPTHGRAAGMGFVSAVGRIGSIAAQFANGSLEANIPALLMVTSTLTLVGGLSSLLLPVETRGTQLD